jgi:hypothetical protein
MSPILLYMAQRKKYVLSSVGDSLRLSRRRLLLSVYVREWWAGFMGERRLLCLTSDPLLHAWIWLMSA